MNGHAKENRDGIRAFFLASMSRLDVSQLCLSQTCQKFHHQCEGAKVYPIPTLWVELISERGLCSFWVICPCYIISFSRAMLILTKYGKPMRDRKDSWNIYSINHETYVRMLKAERPRVRAWPKMNHVARLFWHPSTLVWLISQEIWSQLSGFQYWNQNWNKSTAQFSQERQPKRLILRCQDKQDAIMQTADWSCALFNRSPPWQMTRGRNILCVSGNQ